MRIQISGLTKTYRRGAQPALDGIDLEIRHGTFGLLGPNGAGKTTLIRILATQIMPTVGEVRVDGWDLQHSRAEVRSRLGYLPQRFGAYPRLTAWEFLDYVGRLSGLHSAAGRRERVAQTLHDVGLFDARDRRTGTFSGGMMRRLGVAQAILAEPEFLIVDEPTVGLDPEERIRFRGILARLGRDRAILISTHIVGDISSSCEDLAVLDAGRIVFHGPPEELVARAQGKAWQIQVDDTGFEAVSSRFYVVGVAVDGDHMDLRIVGDAEPPRGASPVDPNLEDAYVYFVRMQTGAEVLEPEMIAEEDSGQPA